MKKKWFLNLSLFAILTTFLAFASCKDYDDDIKKIETGLSSLMSTVDELQQKIESGFAIIDVETTDNGVTIKLSDNKTYTLTNGTSGKEGSVITIGENGNWFIDDIDTKKTSKSTDGVYYMPGDDGFWQIIDGETVIPTTDSWFIESSVIAKWENGYVVLYNVEGSDGPITIGLVGLSKLVLIPDFVTDDSSLTPVINFSSLVTPCGEIAATTTLVKYQVSPNNASESLIDKENIFFKYNNPQSQSNALDLKPQAEFVSLEKGVLTVRTSIDTGVLEKLEGSNVVTQLMLVVPTTSDEDVISDWGKVTSVPMDEISLVRVPAIVDDIINWSEFALVETLASAKNLATTHSSVVDLEFGETLDLLDVVKTMISESPLWSDFDIHGYNLEYAFDLNDEDGNEIVYKAGAENVDQQGFLDLEGSEVSAKDIFGHDIRTPIVHVVLKSKDGAHECNVLEGFIKINIIGDGVDPIESFGLVGEWLFDDSSNLLKATMGDDLVLVGSHNATEGPMSNNKAITIGRGSHYKVNHGIKPKQGHQNVNEYSLLFDFMIDDIGAWRSFFQTNPSNNDDGDLFINTSDGTIGVGDTGYSSKSVTPGQWHRLVVSVNNESQYKLYLDGKIILSSTAPAVDSRFSLQSTLLLFADDNGEDGDINVARVSLYNKALTAGEVDLLGFISLRDKPLYPVGKWLFNDSNNLTKATIGKDLQLVGSHKITEGPMPDNGAITIGAGSHYKVNHGIKPKQGQQSVNEYSLLFDVKVDLLGEFKSLYQTDPNNNNDGELFIRPSDNTIGTSTTGYSTKGVTRNKWHRLVLSVNNGSEFSLYIDTEKILTGNIQNIDGRFSLESTLLLFADDNGEDGDIDVAQVVLYDVALKPGEVSALGEVEVPPNPFLTTPYLQNATTTGITIMWESEQEAPGKVYYGTDDSYGNEVVATSRMTSAYTYVNKAVIKGLTESTEYEYIVDQSGAKSLKQSFKTAPSSDNASFTTAVWADSHYTQPWSNMVDHMMTHIKPDFTLNAGDLSNSGSRSDIGGVFLPLVCEKMGSQVPFYSALGNHDMGTGGLIREFHDQPKEVNSDINGYSGSYLMMYSNVAFIFIDWNRMSTDLIPNGWFERTLQSDAVQNARFRFVFIHCAPYYERWQVAERNDVKNNLPRIAENNNVDAVFSGHMHGYERSVKGGVQYLTIGGASYLDHNESVGPVIYDFMIRGTNKPGNPPYFNNGLRNHVAEMKVEGLKTEIKIHYFNPSGIYESVIETITLDNSGN